MVLLTVIKDQTTKDQTTKDQTTKDQTTKDHTTKDQSESIEKPKLTKEKLLPEIGESPHHPSQNFPFKKKKIGKNYYNFKLEWLAKFDWIHFVENEDKVYCFYCVKSLKEKICSLKSASASNDSKTAFIYNGFDQWQKAQERFQLHQNSQQHKDVMAAFKNLKSSGVDEILDTKTLNDRARNRKCFMKILQVIRLLAQRNIPLVDKDTRNSNVYHFTKLRALDDPDLEKWLEKKRGIYLHHEIITKIVEIMAMKVLREKILRPIQKGNNFIHSFAPII